MAKRCGETAQRCDLSRDSDLGAVHCLLLPTSLTRPAALCHRHAIGKTVVAIPSGKPSA